VSNVAGLNCQHVSAATVGHRGNEFGVASNLQAAAWAWEMCKWCKWTYMQLDATAIIPLLWLNTINAMMSGSQ
jgi:hypothetical protein